MRRRRIEAKARVIARAFLAGERGATETCWLLMSQQMYEIAASFSDEDQQFLRMVHSETDTLPAGELQQHWHKDFLEPKLEQITRFDLTIAAETRELCERILKTMVRNRVEKQIDEHR